MNELTIMKVNGGSYIDSRQQTARKREADKKTAALAKDALSETVEPKDIVDALVEKVLVFPGNQIEIHWKFANFAEANDGGNENDR